MANPVKNTNLEQIIKNIIQAENTRLSDDSFTPDGSMKATSIKRLSSINYISPGDSVTIGGTGTTHGGP